MTWCDQVALHEAGHACAALLLGKEYGAAIFQTEDGNASGVAGPGELSAPDLSAYKVEELGGITPEKLKDEMLDAVITAAGTVAVDLALGRLKTEIQSQGDRVLLTAAAWRAFPDCDYGVQIAFENLAIARARRLLGPAFFRVQRVAAALSERRRLTAAEVAGIMFPAA